MHPIQGVLFDFDGTLAPNLDLPDMRRRVIELTQDYGVPQDVYADRYIVEIITAGSHWLAQQNPQRSQAYHARAHQFIRDFEVDAARLTDPFPGIRTLLQTLRDQGLAMGVVTRNCREAVLAVFPDLLDFVDVLHARDDTDHLKPDPRHLQTSLAQLSCEPSRSMMVGDGALDMHAGRALDMYCVGVLSGSADADKLRHAGAHVVLDQCIELPRLIPAPG